ncbi:MAG: radical SAM protein [Anaerolineales bacterium]|nr:radical SAM protein [Anaerolineales bacterium]
MKYVFGPVPSRRLGQSLGIDPVPLKTCNWNCVYCQLGRTIPLMNERREFFPREEMVAEVKEALTSHQPGDIDWVTFIGSGETTLHAGIGWMIRQVKLLTDLPIAVITNGSLLYLPEIRSELSPADAILPSLDAGNARLYRKINRPHPDITFERLVDGLVAFREEYQGKLWIEVMLVRGLNDTEAALKEIAAILTRIRPDEVHILQPERPPVETWVQPPDEEGLLRARAILGNIARVIHPASGLFDLSGNESLVDAVVGIITRHPMREDELVETLKHFSPGEVTATLLELEKSGRAQLVERLGTRFWSASPSYYPASKPK